jgi:hypothetical protein
MITPLQLQHEVAIALDVPDSAVEVQRIVWRAEREPLQVSTGEVCGVPWVFSVRWAFISGDHVRIEERLVTEFRSE